jgi:hypothetical protein
LTPRRGTSFKFIAFAFENAAVTELDHAELIGPGGTNAHESYFEYDGLGQQRSELVRQVAQSLTM